MTEVERYKMARAAREAAWKRLEWAVQTKMDPHEIRKLRHIYERASRRFRKLDLAMERRIR